MKIEPVDIDKLLLDPKNSRFAELYSGSKKEQDLIEYLLYTEAAEEVAKNIVARRQFYPDEALWVIPKKDKFLVKDGNRRCAAAKALQNPLKYGLDPPKLEINQLPVIIYTDNTELDRRIQEQHTHSLFKEWDRIAKALKVYELYKDGSSDEELKEIDSDPSKLVKLASFYYETVKIGGEDLKQLLRRNRKTGGKTIIFERLFSFARQCGYNFKGKPSYEIEILDKNQFKQYVESLISYLQKNPNTTHADVDREKANFLSKLRSYGFEPLKAVAPKNPSDTAGGTSTTPTTKRGSIKTRPLFTRKKIAPKLKRLIDECYSLDNVQHSNAKVALARVVFETVLKYVIEETKYKTKPLKSYSHFQPAFVNKGKPRKFTNFTKLREEFIEIVTDTGTKKAFQQFDLDRLHQIIHNYRSGAGPADARTVGENLIPLVEFMLLDESDLLKSLDTKKLI